MRKTFSMKKNSLTALLIALCAAQTAWGATLRITTTDGTDEGFNDPTPVEPVAGNPGTTIGAQRFFVFQAAANQWGSLLESNVDIQVQAGFDELRCEYDSSTGRIGAVLGAAGPYYTNAFNFSSTVNFTNAPIPDTHYHAALANSLAGFDLNPTLPDIQATYNSFTSAACRGLPVPTSWWYGVNPPVPEVAGLGGDLYSTVLHELGHGLGFSAVMEATRENPFTGDFILNTPQSGRIFSMTSIKVRPGSRCKMTHLEWVIYSLVITGSCLPLTTVAWFGAGVMFC